MKSDDKNVLREVQKNTQMAMQAIDSISSKIYDDTLAAQVTKDSMRYWEIYNRATNELLQGKAECYKETGYQEMMLRGAVKVNTMLNSSTSHVAELLIQGTNRGLTDMWKIMNRCENAGDRSVEIAKELMDFEEKSIEKLKEYL